MNKIKTATRLSALIISALAAITFPFNVSAQEQESVEIKTITLQLNNFDAIDLAAPAKVHIYQSKEFRVELKGTDQQIEYVNIYVDDKELEIRKKQRTLFPHDDYSDNYPEISIYMPKFKELSARRAGHIIIETTFNSKQLSIETSSAGRIDAMHLLSTESIDIDAGAASVVNLSKLQAERASVEGSSAASIKLTGPSVAQELKAYVSSASNLNASNWECKEAYVKASSAANATVNATDFFTGKASSAAGIKLYGKARTDVSTSSGATFRQKR